MSLNLRTCLWLNLCSATADVSGLVLFYSGHHRLTSLSDVHLTALAGYAVNPRSPQYHAVLYRTKETAFLPGRQVKTFNVMFGQYSVEPAVLRLVIVEEKR
jgi:hypothetical protein